MNTRLVGFILVFVGGILITLTLQQLLYPEMFYVAKLPDGSVYDGDLIDNEFNGQGTLEWPDGSTYEGEFLGGLFHGQGKVNQMPNFQYSGDFNQGQMTGNGTLDYANGDSYAGQVKNGLMNGKGSLKIKDGVYTGEFRDNEFHGEGKFTSEGGASYQGQFEKGEIKTGHYSDQNGTNYRGDFKDWMYDGEGTLTDSSGDKYVGHFSFGSLNGKGELFKKNGTHYEGQFEIGQYQGVGRLELKNGDVYQGEFNFGSYHGQGVLALSSPVDGVFNRSGKWKYGKLIESDNGIPIVSPEHLNETALYNQIDLMRKNLDEIEQNNSNKVDLYFFGISGDGSQSVFRREVQFVESLFKQQFKTEGKSTVLINSRETVEKFPLATNTSIKQTIENLAAKMDVNEDILFIYMTSHGSKDATFSLRQTKLGLPNLTAESLSNMLKSVPIKWKVIVVSACYSGQFIRFLRDDYTLIITAAAKDKTSFGCADDAEFTYFGDAYFNQALKQTSDFVEAFDLAVSYVEKKEKAEKYEQSNPRIVKPKAILEQLEKWKKNL